jgi:hypothetical protein
VTALCATGLAVGAGAQHGPGGQQQQQQQQQQRQQQHQQQAQTDQLMRMQRMQETMRHMERVMSAVRQNNRWMDQNHVQNGFRRMGRELEGAGERLQVMLHEMERLCEGSEMRGDRDRLRQMDRLQERLHVLIREMDETRETLRNAAGAP